MSGEIAVALLNRSESNATITFNLESIGLDASKSYTIKDLWTKEPFLPSIQKEISREVAGHGIVVLKINGKLLPYNMLQQIRCLREPQTPLYLGG